MPSFRSTSGRFRLALALLCLAVLPGCATSSTPEAEQEASVTESMDIAAAPREPITRLAFLEKEKRDDMAVVSAPEASESVPQDPAAIETAAGSSDVQP